MTYFAYQIGDLSIYGSMKGVDGKGTIFEIPRKWDNPTAKLTDIGGEVSFLPATRSIREVSSFSIKGTALASVDMAVRHFVERLKNMGGRRDIPLIVFRAENGDCDCGDCFTMDWLVATCTLLEVPVTSEWGGEDAWSYEKAEVNISGVMTSEFRRLSEWFWQYRDAYDRMFDPSLTPASIDLPLGYFPHPKNIDEMVGNGFFFKWSSDGSDFDPAFWALKYNNQSGGMGSDFSDFGEVNVLSNQAEWSEVPVSIYAFTDLTPTGEIEIEITKKTGFFQGDYIIESSTLDLEQLDADLASFGYGGLASTDVIFTGVVEPFPGYVLKDGQIITDVRPKWSYVGLYPGELGLEFSKVRFNKNGTSGLVAYLFEYGAN